VWAVTGASRKPIPVDAEPAADGNVELAPRLDGPPYAITWGSSHVWPADSPRYRAHFATCPHANEWRARR
jgi:hypothetical protein